MFSAMLNSVSQELSNLEDMTREPSRLSHEMWSCKRTLESRACTFQKVAVWTLRIHI